MNTVQAELSDFKEIAKYFKSASGFVTVVVTFLPAGGYYAESLVPVWSGAPILAVLASLVFANYFFFFFRQGDAQAIESRSRKLMVMSGALLMFYFCLNWTCIFEKEGARVMTGFFTTEEARSRVASGMADSLAKGDLLSSFGYNHAELAWKDVAVVNVATNLSFCLGSAFLSAAFFLIVLKNYLIDKAATDESTSGKSEPERSTVDESGADKPSSEGPSS